MEFGKVTPEELEAIQFTIPPDRAETSVLLSKHKRAITPEVYIGCAKWGRKDWIGKIYPEKTKEANFLPLYAKHFNSIELNATFYRLPRRAQTKAWKDKVGDNFKFCPKVSQGISHIKRLKDVDEIMDKFLEGISGFENTLGSVFLMPHPGMGPKSIETIQAFVEAFPKDISLYVELRHVDWFKKTEAFQQIFDFLEQARAGSAITDAAGRRDCMHMRLTTPEAFIRFVGNGLHHSDYVRVDQWVNRIKTWFDNGLQKVYFFMHQHEEIHSPELCKYVIQKLNDVCHLNMQVPVFIEDLPPSPEQPEIVPKKRQSRKT